MRLYAQTILIVALTTLAVAALLLITFELTVMGSLSDLEQEYVNQDLNRAENAIASEVERLSGIARDWAIWDATYEFVQDKNPDYYTSNFAQTTLKGLNIAAIAIYDLNGTLIAGLEYNKERNESESLSQGLDTRLRKSGLSLSTPEIRKGIITGSPTPLVISTSPILNSEMEGPARGTLIVADLLDDEKIRMLSDDLLRSISITSIPADKIESLLTGNNKSDHSVFLQPDTRVITDISGRPALLLTIPRAGDLYRSGLYSRAFLLASLLLLTLLFMGLASWLLNRIIIHPLQVINQDLIRIGESGSLSERIHINRSDEIGDLAVSINSMLALLGESQQGRLTSEQRLSKLIELVEEGICLVGPDGLIWFANPTMATIFDTTPHDLTSTSIRTLLVTDNPEHSTEPENDEECIPCLSTGVHEYHNRTASGKEIWVRVSTTPYPLDTGRNGQLCVVTDITLFRTAERDLLLSNKKLALLGSMTRHDIVNQLTTIRGMLGLIKRKNTEHALDTLIGSAEDASEKINKHIEFSKEYQKAGIEEPRWQDLRTIWNLAYAMARKRALTFTITGGDYEIYADQLLQKVFYNLIENSIRHGKDLFHMTVSTKTDGPDLLIMYEDDGGGIPDAMKDRIFERGVGTGTGWGLFFAHEVLDLTGMSISEAGTYGIGALFIIRVPEGVFRQGMSEETEQNGGNPDTGV